MSKKNITQERLKELLTYHPDTGLFTRNRKVNGSHINIGEVVGIVTTGRCKYWNIHLDGYNYNASNLAFLYMEGYYPSTIIDHKDLDKLNNKWENLRQATDSQNSYNTKVRSDNLIGVKGLTRKEGAGYTGKGWQIRVMGSTKQYTKYFSDSKWGGLSKSKEAAIAYLQELREQLHGEYANHG